MFLHDSYMILRYVPWSCQSRLTSTVECLHCRVARSSSDANSETMPLPEGQCRVESESKTWNQAGQQMSTVQAVSCPVTFPQFDQTTQTEWLNSVSSWQVVYRGVKIQNMPRVSNMSHQTSHLTHFAGLLLILQWSFFQRNAWRIERNLRRSRLVQRFLCSMSHFKEHCGIAKQMKGLISRLQFHLSLFVPWAFLFIARDLQGLYFWPWFIHVSALFRLQVCTLLCSDVVTVVVWVLCFASESVSGMLQSAAVHLHSWKDQILPSDWTTQRRSKRPTLKVPRHGSLAASDADLLVFWAQLRRQMPPGRTKLRILNLTCIQACPSCAMLDKSWFQVGAN